MAKFTPNMYEQLKATMKEQRSGGSFKDILKMEIGKSYLVRLIPNVTDIKKTSWHYFNHGWKSLATGQFVSCVCPTTFGDRCPICEERIKLYRQGDKEDKENAKMIGRKEQWLINAYIIEDQTNKENNGTIKVFRYGKQIDSVIKEATEGDDAKEFGMKIYDLSDKGCNLRIKVEKNDGGYPTYIKSKFLSPSAIESIADEAAADKIYSKIIDLNTIFERKTPEQVNEMILAHFYCKSKADIDASTNNSMESEGTSVGGNEEAKTPVAGEKADVKTPATPAAAQESDDDVDAKLKDLMKDL